MRKEEIAVTLKTTQLQSICELVMDKRMIGQSACHMRGASRSCMVINVASQNKCSLLFAADVASEGTAFRNACFAALPENLVAHRI